MTEGAGRPAIARLVSRRHVAGLASVFGAGNHCHPKQSVRVRNGARRYHQRRTRLSCWAVGVGGRTLTRSRYLELAMGIEVGGGIPLTKYAERIVCLAAAVGFG